MQKNIKEIIVLQNYCKDIIQELYNHESRPYGSFSSKNRDKIEEAIRLDIIEHDNFDDALSLSVDTEDYYRTRLGQNNETNIGYVGEKIIKLKSLLKAYNIRIKNSENTNKETKWIYKLLNQIPSVLKYNLKALSSNSVFAFKNEPNFEIKMMNLEVCKNEISELSNALKNVDRIIDEEWNFFRNMDDVKINFVIKKIKRDSIELEKSFARLHGDIINFINQSITDGEFIKKLKRLKEIKDENVFFKNTNIEELVNKRELIFNSVKEKKILPEDKMFEYVEQIQEILKQRENLIINEKEATAIDYDIRVDNKIEKSLYNYSKINSEFLAQEKDLITFLLHYSIKIEEERVMGVFIRLLKNYSKQYSVENMEVEEFIQIDNRIYLKVFSNKLGKYNVN